MKKEVRYFYEGSMYNPTTKRYEIIHTGTGSYLEEDKMTRKEANKLILEKLHEQNEKWNDLRFGQLLIMSGITIPIDDFYIESTTILENVKGETNG